MNKPSLRLTKKYAKSTQRRNTALPKYKKIYTTLPAIREIEIKNCIEIIFFTKLSLHSVQWEKTEFSVHC